MVTLPLWVIIVLAILSPLLWELALYALVVILAGALMAIAGICRCVRWAIKPRSA